MLRVRTVFTGVAGSPWYSNLYFAGEDEVQAQPAAEAVRAFWQSCAGYVGLGITINVEDDVPVINEATGVITGVYTAVTAPVAGTNAADALPRSTQGLMRLRTAGVVAGRRVLGRVFLPGFGEGTSNAQGLPNGSDRALIDTAFATNLVDSSSAALVVWSRPVEGGREGSQHLVTSANMWGQWAVLRSRRD